MAGGGKRDVEQDLRAGLAQGAKDYVILIKRTLTTPDAAVDLLVDKAFGSAERLEDAAELLDEAADSEAKALLVRARRYALDPRGPQPPQVRERPDASRFGGSGDRAAARGGDSAGGGCYSGEQPRAQS